MLEQEFIQSLLDKQLYYVRKYDDMELYHFCFNIAGKYSEKSEDCTHILHALCRFKVICRKERKVYTYYEDTPIEKYEEGFRKLFGLKISRVGLSEKNDLWLDFGNGECWVVFSTFEYDEESWRLFKPHAEQHLVASATCIEWQ